MGKSAQDPSQLLGRVVDKVDALLDIALEAFNGLLQESLLLVSGALQGVSGLLCSVGSKLDRDGEEVNANFLGNGLTARNSGEIDVARLNQTLLTLGSPQDLLGESEAGVSHGEGGGTSAILGLDDLVATELNTVDESIVLVVGDSDGGRDLAEEGHNGLARVSTDNGDGQLLRLGLASDLGHKGLGADNVKSGDTEEALGVEDVLGLENLGRDGHGGVDRVGDDEDEGLGGDLSSNLDEALDNAGVDLEQVITGHAGLARNASGDDNDVRILEGGLGAIVGWQVSGDFRLRRDVGEIGCDAGGVDNIVESQLVDEGACLEEKREGLTNATGGASNDSFDHCDGLRCERLLES
jgi:hypothetical protein